MLFFVACNIGNLAAQSGGVRNMRNLRSNRHLITGNGGKKIIEYDAVDAGHGKLIRQGNVLPNGSRQTSDICWPMKYRFG